jgi:hypothetical protein
MTTERFAGTEGLEVNNAPLEALISSPLVAPRHAQHATPQSMGPVVVLQHKNSAEMISGMIPAELAPARAAKLQTNWAGHGGRTATTSDPSGSRLVICLAWFWVTPATGSVIG